MEDLNGNKIIGTFYEQKLKKTKQDVCRIEHAWDKSYKTICYMERLW